MQDITSAQVTLTGRTSRRGRTCAQRLYRRWPIKDDLIVAVVTRIQDEVPVEYSGDVRADLIRYLSEIVRGLNRMRQPRSRACSSSAGTSALRRANMAWTAAPISAWRAAVAATSATRPAEVSPDAAGRPASVFAASRTSRAFVVLLPAVPLAVLSALQGLEKDYGGRTGTSNRTVRRLGRGLPQRPVTSLVLLERPGVRSP